MLILKSVFGWSGSLEILGWYVDIMVEIENIDTNQLLQSPTIYFTFLTSSIVYFRSASNDLNKIKTRSTQGNFIEKNFFTTKKNHLNQSRIGINLKKNIGQDRVGLARVKVL